MTYSGVDEIRILFGICLFIAGLFLNGTAWYIQYSVLAAAVVFSLLGFWSRQQSPSS